MLCVIRNKSGDMFELGTMVGLNSSGDGMNGQNGRIIKMNEVRSVEF